MFYFSLQNHMPLNCYELQVAEEKEVPYIQKVDH